MVGDRLRFNDVVSDCRTFFNDERVDVDDVLDIDDDERAKQGKTLVLTEIEYKGDYYNWN